MAVGMEVTGLDELIDYIQEMEMSDQKVKRLLNNVGDNFVEIFKKNIAIRGGGSKRSIKKTIKRFNGDLGVFVRVSKWRYNFQEIGSKNSKHEGRIYNALDKEIKKSVDAAVKEVFKI